MNQNPNTRLSFTNPYLLLTLTTLIWGGNTIAGKLAVGHVSPFSLTFLRWCVALAILLPFSIPYLRKDWDVIKSNLLFIMALGFVGFACFNNMMYLSLNYTTAINAAIIQASMPLIVFFLNFMIFRINVAGFQLIGFLISLAGVLAVITRGDFSAITNGTFNIGDLIMLLAISLYGAYSVMLKEKPQIHLMSLMSVLAFSALLGCIPFTLYEVFTQTLLWPDAQGWGVVIFAAIFPSLISQFSWVMGIEKIGSNRGGLFINLVPVFGAFLAIILLNERFQVFHAIGLVLVLGGIALAQRKQPPNGKEAA